MRLGDRISDWLNDRQFVRESVLLLCSTVLAWQLTRRRWPEWITPVAIGLAIGLALMRYSH